MAEEIERMGMDQVFIYTTQRQTEKYLCWRADPSIIYGNDPPPQPKARLKEIVYSSELRDSNLVSKVSREQEKEKGLRLDGQMKPKLEPLDDDDLIEV